tara:strand:- start:10167 stop:11441 length:1275 start_codon:yes stop_codon:yes gene_type:complete
LSNDSFSGFGDIRPALKKKFIPAYLLSFVNVLGFSILMPILPFVVESYDAPKWVFGLLLTLYSSFQFFGSPFLGALSDDNGRKPILIISQAGTLFSWLIFLFALYLPDIPLWGYALPLWIIALSRILDGLTGGNISVANAYVADITDRTEKSYIFGYLGGITGLGMIIGPGIGGLAASTSLGYMGTILVSTGVSTITLIAIFFWLKESHQPDKNKSHPRRSLVQSLYVLKHIREIDPDPAIKLLFTLKLFFSIMMAFYIGSISLFLIDLFHFDEQGLGTFMFVVGMFLSFNQAFLSKRFIKRFGAFPTLLIGLGLSFLGLFSITLTDNLYLFIAFYYVMNLGLSLSFPTFNSLISIHANPEKLGETMGVSESINSLAMALFPVISATLYGMLSFELYYLISALPLTALLIALTRYKKLGKKALA